mmetsp:Transcript_15195/g.49872  ORF Transcript_15195/g.49872 Transcript_15195/m.49872 type:complete len:108 (+) Transcript_15195:483-806(+)
MRSWLRLPRGVAVRVEVAREHVEVAVRVDRERHLDLCPVNRRGRHAVEVHHRQELVLARLFALPFEHADRSLRLEAFHARHHHRTHAWLGRELRDKDVADVALELHA